MNRKYLCFDVDTKGEIGTTKGLDPQRTRIMQITIKSKDFEKIITHYSEKKILIEFFEYVKQDYILVGFNSKRFDVKMLKFRCLANDVRFINFRDRHIDLREIISNGDLNAKGKLRDMVRYLGYSLTKSGFSKSNIRLYWQGNKIPELIDRLLEDVRITYFLFEKCTEVNLIERNFQTVKSRTKVVRRYKKLESLRQIMFMFFLNYNFLKPHKTLEGKTPADAAGIGFGKKRLGFYDLLTAWGIK